MPAAATDPARAAPSHRRAPSTASTAGIAALLTVGLTAIAWFRLDGTTRGTGWADDRVFLQDSLNDGIWSTLLDPYAGYLHVVPRLVVQGVLWATPLSDFAAALTLALSLIHI